MAKRIWIWIFLGFIALPGLLIAQDEGVAEDDGGEETPTEELAEFESEPKKKGGFFGKVFKKKGSKTDSLAEEQSDKEPRIRSGFVNKVLGNFTFGASIGYGRNFYKHDLTGFALVSRPDSSLLYIIEGDSLNLSGSNVAYREWVNKPVANTITITSADNLVVSDSASITYRGAGTSIPFDFFLYYRFNRYRIGAGFTLEFHTIGSFIPSAEEALLGSFQPAANKSTFTRYYILLGADLYRYYRYNVAADVRIGKRNLGGGFDKSLASTGLFANLGVMLESNLSEILTVFLRPSYDIKGYTMDLPGADQSIKHNQNGLYLQAGATYTYPDLPRCPIKACATQMNHSHYGKKFRSRRHKIYKWQDPNYGENDPLLFKDKWPHKKKHNPY